MKTSSARSTRRSHDLLREFFACAVVIASIAASAAVVVASAKRFGWDLRDLGFMPVSLSP